MISENCLKKQIARLLRLPFAPAQQDDVTALGGEFSRVLRDCASDAHLEAVIDRVIDESVRVPAPAEVRATVAAVLVPEVANAPNSASCTICAGSGWQHFERRAHTAASDYVADYADFCICDLGRWRSRTDGERERKAQEKRERKSA